MTRAKILVVFVLLLFVVLGLYLFKKSKTPEVSTDRVYTDEKVTEEAGMLIENFPDIPIYPGITVDKTYKKEQSGKTDYTAVWFYEGNIHEIMNWYADELKKAGWTVVGPFVFEAEDDLEINAENSMYTLRLLNSERGEDETGKAGKLIMADILEK
ncbi:hypothetical protein A2961_02275 [Candidatus Woesebacteria bacterium RIFCSPLOWO2_01_FULL_39_21]|uniref:Uncharacterized protein n=1 Tax=Candidatus Woesebacteria bacterium RIFCSPLOWO2_01_FULL_39_21 TaxID=1802519 RepID=A0A1F8BE35_9BACT|nr:MAG: hypothetical protein A2961_02275 [Candidatus Woesebacteria bacterium RIFCSPLOWO2_01_FULL_39_21]